MKKVINYRDYFYFPDIPTQPFPTYVLNKDNRLTNFKSIIYPTPKSSKRYTRNKQLKKRSLQAKIFDALINIDYFFPHIVYKEFPIPIQNCYRLKDQKRLYYIIDYYFPEFNLAVELDSDYHDDQIVDPDCLRDEYLKKAHSMSIFRIRDLQKESVQKSKFKELVNLLKQLSKESTRDLKPLIFNNDLYSYLSSKGL